MRWHLLMSSTAFKFDIGDPQTIRDFVERVQSPERLKLLLVLTVADIRAVGPHVWNGWKAALLRELYHSALDMISGGLAAEGRDSRIAGAQAAARALLPDFADAEFAAFAERGYPFYWLSLDPETHARHARLMREAEATGAPLTVEKRVDPQRAVTEITLYTADHPGLFSRIAGALAVCGANIVDAKIMTMSNGMALDTLLDSGPRGQAVRPRRQAGAARCRVRECIDRRPQAAPRTGAPAGLPEPHQRLHRAAPRTRRQSGEQRRTPLSRSTAATGPACSTS